jgi:hypothetical protein
MTPLWKEQDALWKSDLHTRQSNRLEDHERYPDYCRAKENDKELAKGILESIQTECLRFDRLLEEHRLAADLCEPDCDKNRVCLYGVSNAGDCFQTQIVLAATSSIARCQYSISDYRKHGFYLRRCAVQDMHGLIRNGNGSVWDEVWPESWELLAKLGPASDLYKAALMKRWSNFLDPSSTVDDYKNIVLGHKRECMELYLDEVLAKESTYAMRAMILVTVWILFQRGLQCTIHTMGNKNDFPAAPVNFRTSYEPMWSFDPNIHKVHLLLLLGDSHFLTFLDAEWEAPESAINNKRAIHAVSVIPPSFSPSPRNPYAQLFIFSPRD